MPFVGATTIFALQNPQSTCAAYSQTWLALSLIGNGPLTNLGMIGNQALMSAVQATAGQATAVSLAANGMTIVGAPVVLNNALWKDAFGRLAQCSPGYYYLTVKNPNHAMACCIDSHNAIHYLEPEDSLSRFPDLGTFVVGAAAWYLNRTAQATNQEFKIYQVAPAGTQQASSTTPRPVIGAHRT